MLNPRSKLEEPRDFARYRQILGHPKPTAPASEPSQRDSWRLDQANILDLQFDQPGAIEGPQI